eukprot:6853905-Pyramimonas_sp.AAC.1
MATEVRKDKDKDEVVDEEPAWHHARVDLVFASAILRTPMMQRGRVEGGMQPDRGKMSTMMRDLVKRVQASSDFRSRMRVADMDK